MRRKSENEVEEILFRMTVLEKQIQSRAGQWIVRNGKMWDEGLHSYVLRCETCKHLFLSGRCDKKTCQETCKKKRLKKTSKTNFAKQDKNGQMKLGRLTQ